MKINHHKMSITAKLSFFIILSLLFYGCGNSSDYSQDTTSPRIDGKVNAEYVQDDEIEDDNDDFSDIRESNAVRNHASHIKGNGEDTITMLIYMNGSDLETDDGEASTDLSEIIDAGSSDKVTVVLQTMGTKKWHEYGISSKHSQRYLVNGDGLTLIDDSLPQLDCTNPDTLSDFIKWGVAKYPADRYLLHFWNHGGGPVYGFGYDQFVKDEEASLTMSEIRSALKDAGVYFDCISMDCCIMATIETCCALYDFCDYSILSEEFESGLGWSYTGFMKALYENSSITIPQMAKIAIDDMILANERDPEWGDKSILTLIDESMMKVVFTAWRDFAYENIDSLTESNYSQKIIRTKNKRPALFDYFSNEEEYSLSDYYVTDLMSVAQNVESDASKALESALDEAIVYSKATIEDEALTGLSVTLPYGDAEFYYLMKEVFDDCGIDKEYTDFLEAFVDAEGLYDYYDYDDWNNDWEGWDDYESDYDWSDWDYYSDDDYWEDDDYWGFDELDWMDYFFDDYYDDDYDYDYYDDYYYDDYDYYDDDYYDDWWY